MAALDASVVRGEWTASGRPSGRAQGHLQSRLNVCGAESPPEGVAALQHSHAGGVRGCRDALRSESGGNTVTGWLTAILQHQRERWKRMVLRRTAVGCLKSKRAIGATFPYSTPCPRVPNEQLPIGRSAFLVTTRRRMLHECDTRGAIKVRGALAPAGSHLLPRAARRRPGPEAGRK